MSFAISPKSRATTQPATINNPAEIKASATPFNTLASPQPASSLAQRHIQGKRPIVKNSQQIGLASGTTPSSLENIGRRLAENLLLGGSQSAQPINRIAPSYERRFDAGLGDLQRRLETYDRRLETYDNENGDKQGQPKATGVKTGVVRPGASQTRKSVSSVPEDDWPSAFTTSEGEKEEGQGLVGATEKKEAS